MALRNIVLYILTIVLIFVMILFVINGRTDEKDNLDDIYEVSSTIKDHKFHPDIIKVPSGKKIHFIVTNQDNTPEEFESIELHRERIIMPNESIKIIFAPLAPGTYNFFGEFHQDTAKGSLIVY